MLLFCRRWLAVRGFLWSAVALLITGGCGREIVDPAVDDAGDRPSRGGTLVILSGTDIRGVNELIASHDTFSRSILDQLFLHLFEEQPDYAERPPTMAPLLAETYDWSEDHRVLTLILRQDVFWSDGTPVTADDVHWTWQAQISPKLAWAYAQNKESITDMEVVDPYTLRVTFDAPSSSQLTDLNEGAILPRHAWSQLPLSEWSQSPDWFMEHLVVNGPFTLEGWRPQEEIVLLRNEQFYRHDLPYLDRVVFRVVPEKSNRIQQLLAGQVDLVEQIPPPEVPRIESSAIVDLIGYWHRQYDYICWNLNNPLFADTSVRQALAMGIDRQSLVDALMLGYARIGTSPIISTVWAHDNTLEPWPYDPKRARQLLARMGWQDSNGDGFLTRNGQPFRFELSTNTDSRLRVDAAVMIQEQLARIGVKVEVKRFEFNTLINMNLEHDFDATLGAWGMDTSLDLTYAFHSDSIDDGYNFGSYANPEVDRLIDEFGDQTDPETMHTLLAQIQQILHHDQPYTFLWEPKRLTGLNMRVRNAQPNPLSSFFHLEEWWLIPSP